MNVPVRKYNPCNHTLNLILCVGNCVCLHILFEISASFHNSKSKIRQFKLGELSVLTNLHHNEEQSNPVHPHVAFCKFELICCADVRFILQLCYICD